MSTFRRILVQAFDDQFIKYEDPNAEALCLKYFDFDKDGRISFDDLKQVGEVKGYIFREDDLCKNIVKFNEFKFFGAKVLTFMPFKNFEKLEEIDLPQTLEDTGVNSFHRGSKIKKITIPEGVKKIGDSCFLGSFSPNITIKIPSTVKEIGDNAFSWQKGVTFIFNGIVPPNIIGDWKYSGSEYLNQNKRVVGYAPDESITLYKNSSITGKMCSDILPISQYKG